MEPDTTIELRGQIAGRNHLDRRVANLKNLDGNLAQTQQDRKDTDGETPTQYGSCAQQHTEERRFAEHFVRALFEGNQNCCLTETAPQAAPAPSVSKPEPEVHKTVDMFEDDQELKEQARIARLKKRRRRAGSKLAAKEAEKLRKQKGKGRERKTEKRSRSELDSTQDRFVDERNLFRRRYEVTFSNLLINIHNS